MYTGKYLNNGWVVLPESECYFQHPNSLSHDMMMGLFLDGKSIYSLAWVRPGAPGFVTAPADEADQTVFTSLERAMNTWITTPDGFRYLAVDSEAYNRVSSRER